ncbi:carboxymuconolactone decarboxylase family protein [Actinacidiphila acidipaludis]|uniref:Carboxymuconolactone decarboxylase family protein n=1 Tax=Actinacidiphila acidipaludis TaxID=2873382 RepID=A0ABS7QBQ5_9ACTN|nr:carboxymuconolactone decarboxylase family protein [Streptomyces acidipaludis]MBY8880129.1 carboxymuconolactone decarboxylase family protein [Streptomyces acidipaludis]
MDGDQDDERYREALATAEDLLGVPLQRFLEPGEGEPANGADFKRLATMHTFGDVWPRTGVLDTRTRSLVSVTVTAVLGTMEPLRGQLRIALNNGVTPEEIVEVFLHLSAYAGAARAFEGYQVAQQVFAEAARGAET